MGPINYKRRAEMRFLHELYCKLVLKGMSCSKDSLKNFESLSFTDALDIIGSNIEITEVWEMYNTIVVNREYK